MLSCVISSSLRFGLSCSCMSSFVLRPSSTFSLSIPPPLVLSRLAYEWQSLEFPPHLVLSCIVPLIPSPPPHPSLFFSLSCLKSYDLHLVSIFCSLSCSLSCLVLGTNTMRTNEKRQWHFLGGTNFTRQEVTRRDNRRTRQSQDETIARRDYRKTRQDSTTYTRQQQKTTNITRQDTTRKEKRITRNRNRIQEST